ncbi:peroxisomal short-chain alcohol dehydrogenase [Fusarium phyllophilum]|uniref:Peroxisomal short-chain alcohol dehydrogenase n=1 Tax=Fusarium phyllophilum TaxID=47803 RepID=A0A8H5JWG3_9HYPO|nr:peroxisomal short-chain alcohol dehydrogenase [Fusarium phyllophilum]
MTLPGLKKLHKKSYPAISPTRPELQHENRTVLITGGNRGIGFAIARPFVEARAERVIIVSHCHDAVTADVDKVAKEAKDNGSPTLVEGRICNTADTESTSSLWLALENEGVHVDTLVLSAASLGIQKTLLDTGLDEALISLSTSVVYERHYVPTRPAYAITKLAGTDHLQQVALEVSPQEMQISIFSPGIIWNDLAAEKGFDESTFPWDDGKCLSHFSVWATSPEAEFIHGRFVWAAWDVEELKALMEDGVKKNPRFLLADIEGLSVSKGST